MQFRQGGVSWSGQHFMKEGTSGKDKTNKKGTLSAAVQDFNSSKRVANTLPNASGTSFHCGFPLLVGWYPSRCTPDHLQDHLIETTIPFYLPLCLILVSVFNPFWAIKVLHCAFFVGSISFIFCPWNFGCIGEHISQARFGLHLRPCASECIDVWHWILVINEAHEQQKNRLFFTSYLPVK